MNPDPVAALRDVLAQNAKLPHLEAEIAHLRKHNASAELDAVLDALNEHPSSPEIGDHSMADQVRLIIKWWEETDVENNDAHNALDELGAPDEGTAAERIRALAAAKDRRIAELEEQLRTINAALDRYHANVGIEPGTMQIGQVLDYAATHYLEREHLTSEVRVLEEDLASAPTSEHLPCPFCGGKGFVDSKVAPYSPTTGSVRCRAAVACGKCSMIGPGAVGDNHTESIANAWKAWDRRDGGAR